MTGDRGTAFDDLIASSEDALPKPESRRTRVGIIAVITAGILGIGLVAGSLITPAPSGEQTSPPSGAASPPPTPPRPGTSPAPDLAPAPIRLPSRPPGDDRTITELADPVWVESMTESTGIPKRALVAYAGAALQLAAEHPSCHLGWNTLAAIGLVESDHGTIDGATIAPDGTVTSPIIGIALDGSLTDALPDTDAGRLDGDHHWDRAVGPMQFIPTTWAAYGADGDLDGVRNVQDIDDAALAAARYLCAGGQDLNDPDNWIGAISSYNASIEYNNRVADAASTYAQEG